MNNVLLGCHSMAASERSGKAIMKSKRRRGHGKSQCGTTRGVGWYQQNFLGKVNSSQTIFLLELAFSRGEDMHVDTQGDVTVQDTY